LQLVRGAVPFGLMQRRGDALAVVVTFETFGGHAGLPANFRLDML